jgi:putative nucleotidyltransferase with HDIG domain
VSDPNKTTASEARDALPPASTSDPRNGPRADLARAIPRRPRVSWWLGIVLAAAFAVIVMPSVMAGRWVGAIGKIERGVPAPYTVRVPPFAGYDTAVGHTGGGGVLIARGEVPDRDTVEAARQIDAHLPHGAVPFIAYLLLLGVLAGLFTYHLRRSTKGRLLRVQLFSLVLIAVTAVVVKVLMLATSLSVLVVPVALFAMVPTLVLDRIVGLATGTLAALVVSLLVPFDVGVAVMLMVQAGAAGLLIAERPKKGLRATLTAGVAATLFTAATYPLMLYLTAGRLPLDELKDPIHSAWLASAIGPALATVLSIALVPLYQLLVGEITQSKLVELEDLSHPLLKQIAQKAPGTWQHSLMMANMAEIAANAIGANGRLVRVGAYYHDLGKSLQAKYFIENLEPGETSPHDRLAPETSCDAIFAHVTEGIVTARKAGLHERIIDFMHMHHGNGVLEYFWGKTKEQGNPRGLSVEHFRYPGVPPQSRETAILSICDAVEAASRTLKKPEVQAIDNLVQRIVYGKLHLGQLDESGLSMGDLRRIAESLRETIRHANHGRIEYPWQKAAQDASAPQNVEPGAGQLSTVSALTQTGPRLDSLDRPAKPDTVSAATKQRTEDARDSADALAATDDAGATPRLRGQPRDSSELATRTTAPVARPVLTAAERGAGDEEKATTKYEKSEPDDVVELRATKPKIDDIRAIAPTEPAATKLSAPELEAHETDPRMLRSTNPVDVRTTSAEVVQFATEAKHALDEVSKDLPPLSPSADVPAARKKAATLPPLHPPTQPPPLGRRSPTMPPAMSLRPPSSPSAAGNMTVPPPDSLRPPAAPAPQIITGATSPPPNVARAPGPNLLDDMVTLRPQYELRADLAIEKAEDGSIKIEPVKPGDHGTRVPESDDSLATQPRMIARDLDPGETAPNLERAPASSPVIPLPDDSPWARNLAARLDAQLDEGFGTETPISAPTRAELQALLNAPPDVTKQQSLVELERLHQETRDRRSQPDLDLTRRGVYPTREVEDSDIEAAIELAPPARRNSVGVAKKPTKE